jgi:hypothetical protein
MFIPEPDPIFPSAIPNPGSKRGPDPGSASKSFDISALKTVSKLSEKLTGMFTPDPDFFFIQDPGVKKAPDPDLQNFCNSD